MFVFTRSVFGLVVSLKSHIKACYADNCFRKLI